MTNPQEVLDWLESKKERIGVEVDSTNQFTDCLMCKDVIYNEERGHIATFDHSFAMTIINDVLDLRDDVHMVVDVSKARDPWSCPCYHITWRKNLSNKNEDKECPE